MRSTDQTLDIREPSSLDARVVEFTNAFEGLRELPSRFGRGAPPGAPDPTLLRDALERLHQEHQELSRAREVMQEEFEELQETRRALERERQRYRDLFDDAPIPHLRTDCRGVIREVNWAAARMLAVEPSSLIGRPLDALVEGADGVGVAGTLEKIAADGAVEVGIRVGRQDGTATRAVLHATPAGDGVLWSVRTTCVEVELRPGAERELIEELTAANQAKDHVLAILGHELRTPINVILGWSSLVRRDRLEGEDRTRAMAIIERTAWTQVALLDRLLDASRITASKMMVVTTRLDAGALAREAVEAIGPVAAQRGVRVTCETEPGLLVRGDPDRLSQVLFNLLTNALKFSPDGSQVAVRGSLVPGEHRPVVRLSVKDHGCGIESEHLETIFECFRQVDDRQKRLSGLGLGLFLVREIVALHGGTVRAESAGLGTGTELIVTLPADVPPV